MASIPEGLLLLTPFLNCVWNRNCDCSRGAMFDWVLCFLWLLLLRRARWRLLMRYALTRLVPENHSFAKAVQAASTVCLRLDDRPPGGSLSLLLFLRGPGISVTVRMGKFLRETAFPSKQRNCIAYLVWGRSGESFLQVTSVKATPPSPAVCVFVYSHACRGQGSLPQSWSWIKSNT